MQRGTKGNDAMKNIPTDWSKLVQAMAFTSIRGILESINFVEIKLFSEGQGPMFTTESVVSSPASLGFSCPCKCQGSHGAAKTSLVPCWSWPCLPDLASQLDLRPASFLQICLVITELLANAGCHGLICSVCCGTLWLLRMLPSLPGSLSLADQTKFGSVLLLSFSLHYFLFKIN